MHTFNQIFDSKEYSPRKYLLDDIEKVDIVNQNTILFKMSKKTNSFLPKMDVGILSNINLNNYTEKDFTVLPTPNGTGPFKMKVFRNDYAILESNTDYFHGRPYLNGIVIKVYRDRDEIWSKVMLEEVDTSVLISHGLVDYFQDNENVSLYSYYNLYYYIIAFNMDNDIFRSKNTRIAFNYAVDKQEIISCKDATYFGIAACIADICECIIFNQKRIIPLSVFIEKYQICLSMPVVLGESGIEKFISIKLSEKEVHNQVDKSENMDKLTCDFLFKRVYDHFFNPYYSLFNKKQIAKTFFMLFCSRSKEHKISDGPNSQNHQGY